MADKNNIPEIRFKGFEGEWERKSLKQIAKNISDGDWIEANHIFDNGEYRIIQTGNLGVGEYLNKSEHAKYFHQKDFDEIKANELFAGDILISRLAEPAGRTIILPNTGFRMVTAVDVTIIRPENEKFNSYFFMIGMNRDETIKDVAESVSGTSHKRISRRNLENVCLHVSSLPEQTQIGTYFQNLDNLISLHQRKYNKLLTVKKAMLEKMFPKEGADVPEIRFKGFEGKWEKKKLGDVGIVAMNRRIFKDQTAENGEIPFYKIGTFGSEPDAFITRELFEEYKSKYSYPKYGDILISASGSIGRTVEYLGVDEYFQDSNIVWLEHDQSLTNTFLKYFYSVVKWEGLEGSTIKRLYNKNILVTKINLPSVEEQTKIGTFFQNLDTLITQQQKELEKLKNIKKASLEKMFV